jgi:hypothetical protein
MLLRRRPPGIESQSRARAEGFEYLDEGPIALLGWLKANRVEHIVVGPVGHAIRGDRTAVGPLAIVPAPYARNLERLCRALWSSHARLRVEGSAETLPIKMNEEKIGRSGRWTLRCSRYDLDIEGCPRGVSRYQELLYEAGRFEVGPGLSVEVAAPEDLEHYDHLRRTGERAEIRITRGAQQENGVTGA